MSELITFIPAGGIGSRLHPHTLRTPKPLLHMGAPDKRTIDFSLGASAQASTHTWVSVDYHSEQVESYLDSLQLDITTLHDSGTVGSGGSLLMHYHTMRDMDGKGDTLILPSDHVYENFSVVDFWQKHKTDEADITLLTVPPKPHGEYVSMADGRPACIEKTANKGVLSTTGIFIFSNQFLMNWIIQARHLGEDPNCNIYRDIVCPAVGRQAVSHFLLDSPGFWEDTGTPDRYLASNLQISSGETVIADSAQVSPLAQLERCVVLANTEVEDGFSAKNSIISTSVSGQLLITQVL